MSVRRVLFAAGIVLAGLLFLVPIASADEGEGCDKGFNYRNPQSGVVVEEFAKPKWFGLASDLYEVGTVVEIFGETWDGRYVIGAPPCGKGSNDAFAPWYPERPIDCSGCFLQPRPNASRTDLVPPTETTVPSSTSTTPPKPTATLMPSATPTSIPSATPALLPTEASVASPTPAPTLMVVAVSHASSNKRGLLTRLIPRPHLRLPRLPLSKIFWGLAIAAVLGVGWLTLQNRLSSNSMERIVESAVERQQREEERIEQRGSWLERHDLWIRRVAGYLGPLGKEAPPVTVVLPHDFSVPFQGLGGLKNLKWWVTSQDQTKFSSALFCGLTGTGKTTVAREIAEVRRVPVIYFGVGQLLMDRVGRSEEVFPWVLDQLDRLFPRAVLLWDQAEKEIGPIISGEASYGDGGVRENIYSELTSRMTTNRMPRLLFIVTVAKPEILDEEALRRFDTIWHFPPMDQSTGFSVLKALLKGKSIWVESAKASDESVVWAVGRAIEGLTPDQIKAAVNSLGDSNKIGFNDLVALLDVQERLVEPESWERLTRNPRYRRAH